MTQPDLHHLDLPDGRRLATRYRPGSGPTLVFLPGYASDMAGSKALALDEWAATRRLPMLRMDYSGTGSSSGRFEEGTLGRWIEEAGAAIDRLTHGPLILVGSSMGGWIMLHLALQRPERVAGLLGIAAAPDFTDWGFTDEEKAALRRNGQLERPNDYGPEPQLTTLGFWQSGEEHRLLGNAIAIDAPVRLIHGDRDPDVPLDIAVRLKEALRSADVQLTVVKGGGHRLSAPHEIAAILRLADDLVELAR